MVKLSTRTRVIIKSPLALTRLTNSCALLLSPVEPDDEPDTFRPVSLLQNTRKVESHPQLRLDLPLYEFVLPDLGPERVGVAADFSRPVLRLMRGELFQLLANLARRVLRQATVCRQRFVLALTSPVALGQPEEPLGVRVSNIHNR